MTKKSTAVTIRDVAAQAGVSVATVSRFINKSTPVSQDVADRVSQAMLDLNFTPHATARLLATQRTRTVGLVLTNMVNDFFAPLVMGIEGVVSENQYNLIVATNKSPLRDQYQPPIGPHNTDGMLVFVDSLSEDQLTKLCLIQFPIVLIHRTPPPNLAIPFVTVENKAATERIVDHLIDVHGRKRIMFVQGPTGQEDSRWREMGYRTSLAAHGIPVDANLILAGEFEGGIAFQRMSRYLAEKGRIFDAIFTGDDDAAVGILNALQVAGIKVPEEVSVAGFDDSRLSLYLSPPLTTIHAPTEEVGRTAAKQLFHILNEEPVEQKILLPTTMVLRRSCGCDFKIPNTG